MGRERVFGHPPCPGGPCCPLGLRSWRCKPPFSPVAVLPASGPIVLWLDLTLLHPQTHLSFLRRVGGGKMTFANCLPFFSPS